jgi:hypothetical protein
VGSVREDERTPCERDDILSPSFKDNDLADYECGFSPSAQLTCLHMNGQGDQTSREERGALDPFMLATYDQTPQENGGGVGVYSTLQEVINLEGVESPIKHMASGELISVPELLGLPILL